MNISPDIFKPFILKDLIARVSNPVTVKKNVFYTQIGIRSHGKGIFIKDPVNGEELGNKRVFWIEPNCLIVNIVFAWERAVAKTTSDLNGLIASHRFPMYKIIDHVDLDYLTHYLLTPKGKKLLEDASPGGAGRNKTLNQKDFLESQILLPSLTTQQYISNFLLMLEKRIQLQQQKIDLLQEQKKGYMQKIFKQNNLTWKSIKLQDVFEERAERGYNHYDLLAVTLSQGVTDRTDIKKDTSSEDKSNYKRVLPGDIAYNSMRMWQGASGYSKYTGIVSPAYTILKPKEDVDSLFFAYLFKTDFMLYEFKKYSQGLTSDTWNLKYPLLKDIKVKIPSYVEQKGYLIFY
ncbi:type I restriction endonuclease subunit S [Bacillaceae bacterium SAS-127]|nr:type I restriction endonuclease subunit S [Bacillaceae bacterium SAS-127]